MGFQANITTNQRHRLLEEAESKLYAALEVQNFTTLQLEPSLEQ